MLHVYQENEVSQADKYAELAITADRYNPAGRYCLNYLKCTRLLFINIYIVNLTTLGNLWKFNNLV